MARTEPTRPGLPVARLPHLPALDGLRAIALVAVLCFHGGFGWIRGGYLPLTAFFVLSGFLITSLLLLERGRSGRVDLAAFWGRRARRLVPAAIIALGLVIAYAAAVDRPPDSLRGDMFAALGWVANWRFIFAEQTYADLWGDPSPLQHFWSLAVEEQFYLALPLLAAGSLALVRGRRWLFAGITAGLVAASTLWMRHLYEPGEAPLRSYFGTDTRAAELLIGVLLALVLIGPQGLRRIRGVPRYALEMAGGGALVGMVALWFLTAEYDSYLYESGGLLGIAFLSALVVAAASQEGSLVSMILGLRPLAALGRVSYGVYLFHWPLFLWLNEQRTGLEGAPLFALRVAVTLVLSVASYRLVEQPIRAGQRLRPQLLLTGWANATVAVAALLVVVTSVSVEPLLSVQTADAAPEVQRADRSGSTATSTSTSTSTSVTEATSTTAATPTSGAERARGPSPTAPASSASTATAPPPPPPPPPPPLRVMVVGDSIGVNLSEGLLAVQDKYQLDILTLALNGCSAVVEGTMRWPNGEHKAVAEGCKARRSQWAGEIRGFAPDVVLIHSSIFDILDRQVSGWSDFLAVGDGTYDAWLRGQHRQIISTLAAGGGRVVWATTPCARFDPLLNRNHHDNAEGNRRINLLNGLIRQNGAVIADLHAKVCPGGSFSPTVFGVPGARDWDGVHFSRQASAAMADQWLAPFLLSQRP